MNTFFRSFTCAAATALVACSSSPTAPTSKSGTITQFLPATTVGFVTGDLQSPELRSFIASEEYSSYLKNLKNASAADPTAMAGVATYWDVISALGIVSDGKQGAAPPYGEVLVYAAVDTQKAVEFAAYYDVTPGNDGKKLFAKAKEVLEREKVPTSAVVATGYDAIEIKAFSPEAEAGPALAMYRDTLGLKELYLAASEQRVVASSTKAGLERAFAPAKNEAKPLLEGEGFKKVVANLGGAAAQSFYGAVDVTALAKSFAPSADDASRVPVSFVGFGGAVKDKLIRMSANAIVTPKSPDDEKFFGALTGSADAPLMAKLSGATAIGLSFDGATVKRLVEIFGTELPAEEKKRASDLLSTVQSINLGVSPASGAAPFPEIVISFASSNPDSLLAGVKGLLAEAPLMPGMELKAGTVEGIAVESLPTPLGLKIHLAKDAKGIVIATGDEALVAAVKGGTNGYVADGKVFKAVGEASKSPLMAFIIDYPQLSSVLQTTMQSAAMFGAPTDALPAQQIEQLKHMGRIAVMAGYEPGFATLSLTQELTK